jgi:hypothetical protein
MVPVLKIRSDCLGDKLIIKGTVPRKNVLDYDLGW